MPLIYFEKDELKNLSNKELVKKQMELETQMDKIRSGSVNREMMDNFSMLYECYTNELTARQIDGRLDDDELDDIEEELYQESRQ